MEMRRVSLSTPKVTPVAEEGVQESPIIRERRKSKEMQHYNLAVIDPDVEQEKSLLMKLRGRLEMYFDSIGWFYPTVMVTTFAFLYPLLNLEYFDEYSDGAAYLNSWEVCCASLCGISAMIPLFLDTLLDSFSPIHSKFWLPRFILAASLLVCNGLSIYFQNSIRVTLATSIIHNGFAYILMGSTFYLLHIFDPLTYSLLLVSCTMIALWLAILLQPLVAFTSTSVFHVTNPISILFIGFFSICCFVQVVKLLITLYRKFKASEQQKFMTWILSLEYRDYGCISITLCLAILLIVYALLPVYCNSNGYDSTANLNYYVISNVILSSGAVVIVSIPGRLFKIEASQLNYDLSIKRTFVRCLVRRLKPNATYLT